MEACVKRETIEALNAFKIRFINKITVNSPVTLTKILNICCGEWACLTCTNDITEDHYLIQKISGPKISQVDELTTKNMFYVNTGENTVKIISIDYAKHDYMRSNIMA
uniref:Uncharacterized protein n=1 Tax=Romanomermis culicivorax TaxID=13658 RepID=A0A915L7C8_ROMCU